MKPVAAIDCGTNSIRLLIADRGPDGRLVDLDRRMEVVRLGQDIDRTGVIAPEAMERTLRMCRVYAQACREAGVETVRFVGTSASRDARNAADFVAGVREAFAPLPVAPEVVSGDEEAQLSFRGATGELAAAGLPGPYLVVDLGGGSTEMVRGTDRVENAVSLDIGSVRMTERHLHTDPPTDAEIAAAAADIAGHLDRAEQQVPLGGIRTIVGLAGTITTITATALGLDRYRPDRVHLARHTVAEQVQASDDLLHATREQRATLPTVHPGRIDVIGGGALVWRELLERVAARNPGAEPPVVTSEHDILDGIALSILG